MSVSIVAAIAGEVGLDGSPINVVLPSTQEIVISAVDDSIKIGDGAGHFAAVSAASALKIDGSAVTQPVSGTVAATQSGDWSVTTITGPVALPTDAATFSAQSTQIDSLQGVNDKLTSQQATLDSIDARLAAPLDVNATQDGTWNITNISGTVSLPTGASTAANQTNNLQTTQLVNSSGNPVAVKTLGSTPLAADFGLETNSLIYGLTSAGGGGYVPVKVNPSGTMLVDASGTIVPVSQSGTWNIATVTAVTAITNALPAGSNVIGHVISDSGSVTNATLSAETTKVIGTVNISAAQTVGLVAGSAIIGKVGIDQTTPGTTNGVQVNAALPAGANVIGHVITDSSSVTNATLSAETTKVIGTVRNQDGAGNNLTSQTNGAARALDVGVNVAGVQIDPRTAAPGTLTDRSGTATSTSATMMAVNANRRYLFIQNLGNAPIYINFTSAATVGAGSIELSQFASFVMEDSFITTEAVTVIRSGGANLAFTAKEG